MKYSNVIIMKEINKIALLKITAVISTKSCNMNRKFKRVLNLTIFLKI